MTDQAGNTSLSGSDSASRDSTPPVAINVLAQGEEDAASILVTLSASDTGGPIAGYTITSVPANGTLYSDLGLTQVVVSGATVTSPALYFVPNPDWSGNTGFSYTATDLAGNVSAPAAASIQVDPVSDAPTLTVSAASGNEDTAIALSISTAQTDTDGSETLTIKIDGIPAGATLANTAGDTLTISGGSITLTPGQLAGLKITPPANSHADFDLTVTAISKDGTASAATTVDTLAVTVNAVADLTAGDDNAMTDEDVAIINGSVAGNDSTTSGGSLSFVKASDPTHGAVTVNSDGSYSYTPALNYSGADSFTYTVTDTASGESLTRTVTLIINPVADTPTLTLTNKTYSAATTLDEQDVSGWGFVSVTVLGGGVWKTDNASGNVEIGDARTYLGGSSLDQVIELEAAAGDASNLYTTMAVKAGEVYALSFDYALRTGQTTANSTFSVFWNGTKVAEIAPTSTTLTNYSVNLLSSITGTGKLELRANDSSSVGAVLDNISLALSSNTGYEDQPINLPTIAGALTDTDGSETLALTISSIPVGAVLSDGTNTFTAVSGSTTATVTGWNLSTLTLTPPANFNGNIPLTVTATSTEGANASSASTTSTINLLVLPVNDAPAGADKTITTSEDTPYILTVADFGFTDPVDSPANTLQSVTVNPTSAGTLALNGVALTAATVVSVAQINAGLLTFTPAANANGTGYASLSFQVTDNGGTAGGGQNTDQSANAITFNVTAVNDAPVALPATATTAENTVLNSSVPAATDIDGTIASYTLGTGLGAGNGSLVFNSDGSYTFTPGGDFDALAAGASRDVSFTYTATDNSGGVSLPQTVTITVTGTNDAAVITGTSTAGLTETNAVQNTGGTLAATDVDSSNAFVVQTNVAGGNGYGKFSIAADGTWTYTMDTAHNEFVGGTDYTDSITVARPTARRRC